MPALKSRIFEIVAEEGYRPRFTDQGDIVFKVEGIKHYIEFDERDPAYVRLLVPHFWTIDDAGELERAHVAAAQTCYRMKGAKVFVVDGQSVWVSVEYLVAIIEAMTAPMLARHIKMIRAGVEDFRETMLRLADEAEAAVASILH